MTSKAHSTAHADSRLILYVAATDDAAAAGATALEGVGDGHERTVHPVDSAELAADRAANADCVVVDGDLVADEDAFATVVEAAAATPLIVFATGPYDATQPSNEAVDGYVRRDTEDAHVHLVDEIARVCQTAGASPADPIDDAPAESSEPEPEDDPELDARTAATVFETTAGLVDCRDRDRLFRRLVDGAVEVLEFDHCWLTTINFGELVPRAAAPAVPDEALAPASLDEPLGVAFRAREPIRIADLATYEWIEPPFEGARSLCSVPVGDVGVLHVASESADAIDGRDLALLEGLCGFAATILERNWTERGIVNERDRLQRERERVVEQYNRLKDERDALFTLFRNVAEPTVRYDLEDGEAVVTGVNATFEAVFDVDREEIVGDPVDAVALPEGLAGEAAALADAIRGDERTELEVRRETPDGLRDFVVTVVPLSVTEGGTETGGLLVYEDVTDRKRRERELLAATHRLERLADRIDEDVRTPLNTARGYLELAEKTGDAEHFEVVDGAHEELSVRLQELVELATGDTVEAEPVSLADAATRAWIAADTSGATLVTEDDALLEANRSGLRELFEHVLRTTIELEAVEDDSDPITVSVGATDDGFYVAGSRPGDDSDPEPGSLDDADGSEFQLELVERIADAHGWDVGVAADDDGTAIAFRGVDVLE
ncbi:GAF domain-containing protein [Halopiger goleimassiliensis]|uniref:GAF domain-containing protein n=1 Tax=Halopiger goleimassiliensis TaxID=1293048 RepID=UPI0006782774|nr:GAF domain-containing protein [Halopiger goleimassiliensis]